MARFRSFGHHDAMGHDQLLQSLLHPVGDRAGLIAKQHQHAPMVYSRAVEKRLKRLPDALYFAAILPLLSRLPARAGYAGMRRVGLRLAKNFPEHRSLIVEKLEQNLPPSILRTRPARKIADEFYQVLTAEDLDAYYYSSWNRENIHKVFEFQGLQHLDRQRERGEGAVLVSGHIGGVCAALVALGVLGYPVTHLAREYPEDDSLSRPFYRFALKKVAWMEEKLERPLIYAGAPGNLEKRARTVLEASRALKQGQFVSMAIDIPPFRVSQGTLVRFLGKDCRFPSNFAQVASDCGVPLIPYFTWRDPKRWWRQILTIQPPIAPSDEIATEVQDCVTRMETVILEHPEHWFAWDSIDHFRTPD